MIFLISKNSDITLEINKDLSIFKNEFEVVSCDATMSSVFK